MRVAAILVALFVVLMLTGCVGGMISGKLYSVETGTVLALQIEKTMDGTGKLTARNAATGESFTGQYTAITVGRGAEEYITARGLLTGDKGTMIEFKMQIERGFTTHGHGEGTDNKGQRYQVQF